MADVAVAADGLHIDRSWLPYPEGPRSIPRTYHEFVSFRQAEGQATVEVGVDAAVEIVVAVAAAVVAEAGSRN